MIDEGSFKPVVERFATGVTVVTTLDDQGYLTGLIVNSLALVSVDPPLLIFCFDDKAQTFGYLKEAGVLAAYILAEGHYHLARRLAEPSRDISLLVNCRVADHDTPSVRRYLALMERRVVHQHRGGDHVIAVGEVGHLHVAPEQDKGTLSRRRGVLLPGARLRGAAFRGLQRQRVGHHRTGADPAPTRGHPGPEARRTKARGVRTRPLRERARHQPRSRAPRMGAGRGLALGGGGSRRAEDGDRGAMRTPNGHPPCRRDGRPVRFGSVPGTGSGRWRRIPACVEAAETGSRSGLRLFRVSCLSPRARGTATDRPAVEQGTSREYARSSRRFPSFPRKRESTRNNELGNFQFERGVGIREWTKGREQ